MRLKMAGYLPKQWNVNSDSYGSFKLSIQEYRLSLQNTQHLYGAECLVIAPVKNYNKA